MRCAAIAAIACVVCACGRSTSDASAAPPTSAAPADAPAASQAAAASIAPAAFSLVWSGTYKSAASTLKEGGWTNKDSTSGVGSGSISLSIDPDGRALGSLEGPLGPASIDGVVAGAQGGAASAARRLTATVARKDPSDHGFAGTLVATVAADKIDGTMNLSLGQGSAIRTAAFTLTRR